MEPMLPAERRQKILDIIARELTIRVSSLSEMLGVSEMTIRRDLDYLAERGLAERTHGGAVFIKRRTPGKFQYQSSVQTNPDERTRIARTAATLIEPHDMVYLGEGASTAEMVHFIDPGDAVYHFHQQSRCRVPGPGPGRRTDRYWGAHIHRKHTPWQARSPWSRYGRSMRPKYF